MECLSPPGSVSSSSATTPLSAWKQPTYTTAGTLYDPSSSQPPKPPTRRGRSLKCLGQTSLTLFPKTILAALPLDPPLGLSPAIHQYRPLRQNYDRAISPQEETDLLNRTMQDQTPRIRSGNTPASLYYLSSGTDQVRYTEGDTSENEDDDSDFGMNALNNMTVKSLQNLASYPNPNQKKAQRALLRGAKPNITGLSAPVRGNASPPLDKSHTHDRTPSPNMVRTTQSNSFSIRQAPEDLHTTGRSTMVELGNALNGDAATNGHATGPASTSMTLASGPGAPQPLTAGPPGQRQYRPSAIDSTLKAIQIKHQQQLDSESTSGGEDHQGFNTARQALVNVGIDVSPYPSPSKVGGNSESQLSSGAASKKPLVISSDNRVFGALSVQHEMDPGDKMPWIWSHQPEPPRAKWPTAPFVFGGRWFQSREERIRDRKEWVERHWYAGTVVLGPPTREMNEDGCRPKPNPLGSIGDGRPRKGGCQRGSTRSEEAHEARMQPKEETRREVLESDTHDTNQKAYTMACGSRTSGELLPEGCGPEKGERFSLEKGLEA